MRQLPAPMPGFRLLGTLKATHNGLKADCLAILQRLPQLCHLHLQHNSIQQVPAHTDPEAFSRLQVGPCAP